MEEFDAYVKELTNAAYTDSLTGLKNRRALSDLKQSSLHSDGAFRQISVISFDIDHFKKVNDTYGHDGGDEVLVEVARAAIQNTRDIVFRKGGEEFEIIMLDATNVEGELVAQRLRNAIEAIQFSKYPTLKVTASFGVASATISNSETFKVLQGLADEMAYAAKTNGRNQVQVAPEKRLCELALINIQLAPQPPKP